MDSKKKAMSLRNVGARLLITTVRLWSSCPWLPLNPLTPGLQLLHWSLIYLPFAALH